MKTPEDAALRAFLQSYRPEPPPPSPQLEQQILNRLRARPTQYCRPGRLVWVAGGVAALTAALLLPRAFQPQLAQNRNAEQFVAELWMSTAANPEPQTWDPVVDLEQHLQETLP
jgi:hypothetical protein